MFSFSIVFILVVFFLQLAPVFAQEPSTFTGKVTDMGEDTDDDGLFDYLNLSIEVNITTAATYKIDAGGVYDQSTSASVSVLTEKTTFLDVGIHVIELALNGTEIYASSVNPTAVAGIYLYNETGDIIDTIYDKTLSKQYFHTEFQPPNVIIEFNRIERKIILDQDGTIKLINAIQLTNVGLDANEIEIGFPDGAYNFEVRDEMGSLQTSKEDNKISVTLRERVESNEMETIYIIYQLPWSKLINHQNGIDYDLKFTFFEEFTSPIGELIVSITLPKGAGLQSSSPEPNSLTKGDAQQTLYFVISDVTSSQDLNFTINYRYLMFWASFYPTIWVGIITIIGSILFFFWGNPKTLSAPTIQVQPKNLKIFLDSYEEKTAIRQELEILEKRLQKGKIPRRRYKVRKKMLDGRLSKISRDLSSISEKIRTAGSKYASLMRQIEVAEAKLDSAERDIRRITIRYNRGEISKGAYGKLLEEYRNRMEEAEATIDGVLLRLRD